MPFKVGLKSGDGVIDTGGLCRDSAADREHSRHRTGAQRRMPRRRRPAAHLVADVAVQCAEPQARQGRGRGACGKFAAADGVAGDARTRLGAVHGIRLPGGAGTQIADHRLSGRGPCPGPQLLRSARLRGSPCELHSHCQGRSSGSPLVQIGTAVDAGGPKFGAGPHGRVRCSSTSCPCWSCANRRAACSAKPRG